MASEVVSLVSPFLEWALLGLQQSWGSEQPATTNLTNGRRGKELTERRID